MRLQHLHNTKAPLLNWDFFCSGYNSLMDNATQHQHSLTGIKTIAKANKWNKQQTKETFENLLQYAVVITDSLQQIAFTCHGFEEMTGYTAEEAKGRNPKFLQGAGTNKTNIGLIKQKLQQNEPVETVVENYRKNGELYLCKVLIKPIFNTNQKLVNYIAYEREIAA